MHAEAEGPAALVEGRASHVPVVHLHFHPPLDGMVKRVVAPRLEELDRRGVQALAPADNARLEVEEEHRFILAVSPARNNTFLHIDDQRAGIARDGSKLVR